jgi:hypothetical protein
MYTNQYSDYYLNQAGSGLAGFEGVRFQKGAGIFGFLKSAFMPLLRYIGPKLFETGSAIASDIIGGENWKESVKTRTKKQAQNIAGDVSDRALRFAQTGTGRKRRYKKKKKTLFNFSKKPAKKSKRSKRARRRKQKKNKFNSIF